MNTMGKLKDAWLALLDGALIYNSVNVGVFKEDTDESTTIPYVLIYTEGETDSSNKTNFKTESVVIVDIVTEFENNANSSQADTIDGQILALVFSGPANNNLPVQTGMQILNVKVETSNYVRETLDSKQIYRKVSRYKHTIFQT